MTRKFAVSMPDPMFRDMERARKHARKDRSVWLQETVAERLKREKHEADVAAYIRGYERFPETEEEIAWAEAAWRTFPWDEFDEADAWPGAPH